MPLIPNRLDKIFRDRITSLREDLSKKHTVVVVSVATTRCPNCIFDPNFNAGSGVYNGTGPQPFTGRDCPVCFNAGSTTVETPQKIIATISLADDKAGDRLTSQGNLPAGSVKLKTDPSYSGLLLSATYFLIDGLRFVRFSSQIKTTGLLTAATARVFLRRDE